MYDEPDAPASAPSPALSVPAGAEGQGRPPPLSRPTKLAFGIGAVAPGVTTAAFDFFLLIFYSQVVGLDAQLVGLAILVALVFDAASNPIVGYSSDNLRSRWGRRHPFLYASAIPLAASFYFLWTPPADASQTLLFWYLLTLSVVVRTASTFYQTPASALVPDLTQDYDARTSLYSLRYFLAWVGGNSISVWMFLVLFPMFVTDAISDGRFNPDAYPVYGAVGALATPMATAGSPAWNMTPIAQTFSRSSIATATAWRARRMRRGCGSPGPGSPASWNRC